MEYDTIVIGGGPAGLASVSVLRDSILWIDPNFNGGRLSKFCNVPSNTKTALFLKYASMTGLGNVPVLDRLRGFGQDEGCSLRYAAEMVRELSDVAKFTKVRGIVDNVRRVDRGWEIKLNDGRRFNSKNVVLATGAHPRAAPDAYRGKTINPELLLSPDHILMLNIIADDLIGVVGSSHSAILVLRTLFNHTQARIINFFRSPLRYAEYSSDGIIKYDNTGLKGEAAEWAKTNLCDKGYCCNGRIFRIGTTTAIANNEDGVYQEWLPKCSKVIWAIGYERNPLPKIYDEHGVELSVGNYDSQHHLITADGRPIPDIYGIGIAFPERVVDISGEPELSVGLYKFMRTAQKINPA